MVPKGCQFTIPYGLIGTPLEVLVDTNIYIYMYIYIQEMSPYVPIHQWTLGESDVSAQLEDTLWYLLWGYIVNLPGYIVNLPGYIVNLPGYIVNLPGFSPEPSRFIELGRWALSLRSCSWSDSSNRTF